MSLPEFFAALQELAAETKDGLRNPIEKKLEDMIKSNPDFACTAVLQYLQDPLEKVLAKIFLTCVDS